MNKSQSLDIRTLFGKRVRSLRKSLGLSQEELADLSALDRTYVGGIERGERNVSLLNIEKLALALRTTPQSLFDFEDIDND